jgi:SAM-dependent methyltransferase
MGLGEQPSRAAESAVARAGADLLLQHAALPRSGPFRPIADGYVDGDYLLWVAYRHGMLPFVERALADAPSCVVPHRIASQLNAHACANARRQAVYLREAASAVEALGADGRPVLALRSPVAAVALYDEPGQRQVEPVELLVQEEDYPAAVELLGERGYRPVRWLTSRREAALRRSRGMSAFHHPGLEVRLHLHIRLTPAFFSFGLDAEDLWRRRRHYPGPAGALPGLPPEELLLLICVHGALHLWDRMLWLSDVARLVERSSLDWPRLLALAHSTGSSQMLLAGLRLAAGLLAVDLPPDVRAQTERPSVLRLAESARERLLRDRRGRTGELERACFRLAALERPADRIRYWLGFATAVGPEDWEALDLPDRLTGLYRLVRPLRLAAAVVGRGAGPLRAPFVATPLPVVGRMLAAAAVGPDDLVYDLGCGDGRIVVEAARRYGARGVGIDVDPRRIEESRANARAAGVEHLVSFVEADITTIDVRPASVVAMWTLPALNLRLRSRLQADLRPGSRVVAHGFDMSDWAPTRMELVTGLGESIPIYVWAIGAGGAVLRAGDDAGSVALEGLSSHH